MTGVQTCALPISGNADFPFSPYPQIIEYGIEAKYSVVKDESGIYFLALNPGGGVMVVKISGFGSTQLSSAENTWQLNQLTTTDDAIGAYYNMKGVGYFVLTFPSENVTYHYNVQTGMEHREKSYGISRSRRLGYGSLEKRQFCMDYDNAKLYELDFSKYTEDGAVIERSRRSRVIHYNNQGIIYHLITILIKGGVGNADEPNPVIEMKYSDDSGNTWSSWISHPLGAVGEYNTRCEWRQLGKSDTGRIFEFRCTDPVEFHLLDAFAEVEVCHD